MRYLILTILLFLSFIGLSQTIDEYENIKPEIAWHSIVENVMYLGEDTFSVELSPIDLTEPGAFPLKWGNFLIDQRGIRYKIIDTTSAPTVTVVDIFQEKYAPFQGGLGAVYKSAGDERLNTIPTIDYSRLGFGPLAWGYRYDMKTLSRALLDYTQLNQTPSTLEPLAFQRVDETGTSLENVLADSILLTEFDSTGFRLNANQINGIEVDAPQQFFRTGKFTATEGDNNVLFDIPFPDNDYQVFADGNTTNRKQSLLITNKLSTGFTAKGVIGTPEIEYLAIRRVDSLAILVDSLVSIVQNFDIYGSDSLAYSGDTLYLYAGDSLLSYVEVQGDSGSTAFMYDKLLSNDENVIDIGTDITTATLIFVNGCAISNFTYSGTEVTLGQEIEANDYFVAASSGDTPVYYDELIDSETVVSLPFAMTANSLPFYNGILLQSSQHTGSITLALDVNENDNLIVKK